MFSKPTTSGSPSVTRFLIHGMCLPLLQFSSRNGRSVLLGFWVRQTLVPQHVWTCYNLCLRELQTQWAVRSQAAREAVRVRGVLWKESGAAVFCPQLALVMHEVMKCTHRSVWFQHISNLQLLDRTGLNLVFLIFTESCEPMWLPTCVEPRTHSPALQQDNPTYHVQHVVELPLRSL